MQMAMQKMVQGEYGQPHQSRPNVGTIREKRCGEGAEGLDVSDGPKTYRNRLLV